MNFGEAIQSGFSNYANFSGRARRSEFWYFTLFNSCVSVVLQFLGNYSNIFSILGLLFSLAILIPSLAMSWRRLHDTGKSGAFFFLNFIPLIGSIILIVFYCQDSQPGQNQFGPSPKGNY